jgi:hypothetical protein
MENSALIYQYDSLEGDAHSDGGLAAREARHGHRFLATQSANDVPTAALLSSAVLTQVFLVVTLFANDAFGFALDVTSALVLIPWLLAAAYLVKIAVLGDGCGCGCGCWCGCWCGCGCGCGCWCAHGSRCAGA